MTYDGEPAMKLEKYLNIGKLKYDFEAEIINKDKRKVVRTIPIFEQMEKYRKRDECEKKSGCGKHGEYVKETDSEKGNLAYSAVHCLLRGLTDIAVDEARKSGIRYIGITGGVSYNEPIVNMTRKLLRKQGFELVVHNSVPNGDGGISIGQNRIVGGRRLVKSSV
jgi:hydrogenase maturation protein HypF